MSESMTEAPVGVSGKKIKLAHLDFAGIQPVDPKFIDAIIHTEKLIPLASTLDQIYGR